MNNFGGTILKANTWQLAIPANQSRTEATVQNAALSAPTSEFDPNGINSGPAIWVWPFDADPTAINAGAGPSPGALLMAKPGDSITLAGAATKAAIYVCGNRTGAAFAASEY